MSLSLFITIASIDHRYSSRIQSVKHRLVVEGIRNYSSRVVFSVFINFYFRKFGHNRRKWVAKIEEKISRELIYLLIFYIWQIKYVINVERLRLKKIDLKDENRGINAVLVDTCFKTVQDQKRMP